MAISQSRPKRKPSGKVYKDFRKKRSSDTAGLPAMTKLGDKRIKSHRIMGANMKSRYLQSNMVNLFDPKDKQFHRVEIKSILENDANRHFVRRNVLTKGAVIDTEKGKARLTSRPGQHGTMNAVLI